MKTRIINSNILVYYITIASTFILFAASSIRHNLFQSTAFDLGIFDQAIYLISQGKTPITTVQGFHILGDHAAWIHYILAIPYKIYPSVYWLFFIQAFALSLGALPTYYLSIQAGLEQSKAIVMALVYLFYPVIFNGNLFDFHPEVIAVPLLLFAILAARSQKLLWFGICVIFILGCKAVLSLTVTAMGIWLLFFEKRRLYGSLAIILGIGWFIIATKLIIPFFSGGEAAAVGRYSYLGNSVFEIAQNIIFQPWLIFGKLFSLDNFGYLILLLAPVIWGLSQASFKPLVGAIPCIALNLIADYQAQKDLIHQYSLPALPFLILVIITSLSMNQGWIKARKPIIIWSLITFICLAKFTHFTGKYLESIDTLQATKTAISLVKTLGGVYTTAQITPHLSHRDLIKFTNKDISNENLDNFAYILLDYRHPGWASDRQFVNDIVKKIKNNPKFETIYQKDDVYLFRQNIGTSRYSPSPRIAAS